MNLAINYSPAAADLYRQGKIPIDFFKVPDWPNLIAEAHTICSVAVHFSLQAGTGKLGQSDWDLVDRLLIDTNTPYINVHLDPHTNDFPGIRLDSTDPDHINIVSERLLKDVMEVVERYGPDRVIAENVPYQGVKGEYLRPGVEPEVITRIITESGCGLLLDISHARITAHNLGIPDDEYLTRLPTHRIRELHFAGVHTLTDGMQDHLSILPDDWRLLDWILEQIQRQKWSQPWLLAFEYGGVGPVFTWRTDPEVIASQVPRLYALVHSA